MLTLNELRHVVLLAESSSIGEAAHKGSVTQPALSQSLANIERKLGVQLFVRSRNTLAITRFGELVLTRARKVLNEIANIDEDLQALHQEHLGTVQFGIGPAAASLFLNDAIVRFHREHPTGVPRFRVKFWDDCEKLLLENEVTFFLGGFPRAFKDKRFSCKPFFRDELVAVARRDHPLTRRASIDINDLTHFPAIGYDSARHSTHWRQVEDPGDLLRLRRNLPASTLENPLQCVDIVVETDYVLMLTRASWLTGGLDDRLVVLPIPGFRGPIHHYVVSNAGHVFSAVELALLDCFERSKEHVGDIIARHHSAPHPRPRPRQPRAGRRR